MIMFWRFIWSETYWKFVFCIIDYWIAVCQELDGSPQWARMKRQIRTPCHVTSIYCSPLAQPNQWMWNVWVGWLQLLVWKWQGDASHLWKGGRFRRSIGHTVENCLHHVRWANLKMTDHCFEMNFSIVLDQLWTTSGLTQAGAVAGRSR